MKDPFYEDMGLDDQPIKRFYDNAFWQTILSAELLNVRAGSSECPALKDILQGLDRRKSH